MRGNKGSGGGRMVDNERDRLGDRMRLGEWERDGKEGAGKIVAHCGK